MTAELEETVIVADGGGPGASRDDTHVVARSRIAVGAAATSGDLSSRFGEATRQLLRQRLMIAAGAVLLIMIAVTVIMATNDEFHGQGLMVRPLAIGLIVAVVVVLWRVPTISMAALRRLELVVIAVPVIELLIVQVIRTRIYATQGELQTVETVRAAVGVAVCVLVATYGMFIPGTWRRTAVVTGLTASLPTIVAMIHTWVDPRLADSVDAAQFAVSTLTLSMAAVATVGAHVVHSMRREVEEARQYGQYRLTDEIGRGAMGVVYRAEHRLLKRPAAIKLIRSESAADEAAIARFEHEVQISATLSHWNTVQIYDYGRTATGDFYYVMEYLRGQSLQERLVASGPLTAMETQSIVLQLCDGLQEAHARGMVHRDLKPANIFLAETGGQTDVVKILDFGLATMATGTDNASRGICGTPKSMAPEQIRGTAIDGRADIYAIGCLIFECLTGEPLFAAESVSDALNQHLCVEPALDRIPSEAAEFREIVAICLRKHRDERFHDVNVLRLAVADRMQPVTRSS
ncbi:MAG: serine/threonine-protein kinase [Planctomycetaceae bacterium]